VLRGQKEKPSTRNCFDTVLLTAILLLSSYSLINQGYHFLDVFAISPHPAHHYLFSFRDVGFASYPV